MILCWIWQPFLQQETLNHYIEIWIIQFTSIVWILKETLIWLQAIMITPVSLMVQLVILVPD